MQSPVVLVESETLAASGFWYFSQLILSVSLYLSAPSAERHCTGSADKGAKVDKISAYGSS